MTQDATVPSREQLLFMMYEAAELEHGLMCTYLYAAFSLRSGEAEGLSPAQAEAVARWRRALIDVAVDEMGHLAAVWNITSALGGAPQFWRDNFPTSPGRLPAGVVVKLAPFNEAVLQHFIHLERPANSDEPDGAGFAPERQFKRGMDKARLTPMTIDYETVGTFYETVGASLEAFVAHHGEKAAFCGDPSLQMSPAEVDPSGARPVICLKTALAAFKTIVEQGEGAPADVEGSHYQKFIAVREELAALEAADPLFKPAFPAAHNPVLRPPPKAEGRVWIEDEEAAAMVDIANACYGMMLRLIAYSYSVARPSPDKALAIDLGISLMRAVALYGERAARLPAGASNPNCNAGMSFTILRNASALPAGAGARRFFAERFAELAQGAERLAQSGDARAIAGAEQLAALKRRAQDIFGASV
jgi:hypothetical protein